MDAPSIVASTEEERRAYVSSAYPCRADCDLCGNCAFFHGKEPLLAFAAYIQGREEFQDILDRYRHHSR
ncbi:MAG: hypothetical protein ACOX4F_04400 [Atopobiaceae bacterium]|jgi:hypothetical protein